MKESRQLHLGEGQNCILDTCFFDTRAVMVSLYSEAVDPHTLDIGFVVAPEGFRPGFKAPGNLRSYWKRQIRNWRRSEPVVSIIPAGDIAEGYDCWSVEISCLLQ